MCIRRPVSFEIVDSDLHLSIGYTEKTLRKTFPAVVDRIVESCIRRSNTRPVVAIAGPPGSGKSSIALVLQGFLKKRHLNALVLPLDGFHRKNSDLMAHTTRIGKMKVSLYDIKGAKETYNTPHLMECMEKLRSGEVFYWPLYSRSLHEPVEKGILVNGEVDLYIVEGNYLLLKSEPWNRLSPHFCLKIFIRSRKRFLKRGIISRKMKGGFSRIEARKHYLFSDRRNIDEVLADSTGYDCMLIQKGRYNYRFLNY